MFALMQMFICDTTGEEMRVSSTLLPIFSEAAELQSCTD